MTDVAKHSVTSQLDFENRKYYQQTQANDHRGNRTFRVLFQMEYKPRQIIYILNVCQSLSFN